MTDTTMNTEASESFTPVVGQLLRNRQSGRVCRVLYVSPNLQDSCWWIDINDLKCNTPDRIRGEELLSSLNSGSLEAVIDNEKSVREDSLSEAMKKSRDRVWELIRDVVAREPEIYQRAERTDLLKQVEAKTGVPKSDLYRYLGKYWRGGKDKNALLPGYRNCGGHRTENSVKKRLGRPKKPGSNGKILNQKDFENFADAIDHHYSKSRNATLSSTYHRMIGLKYTTKDSQGNVVSLPPDEIPSINQFLYWYHRNRDSVSSKRKKDGEHKFALSSRAITGKTECTVSGPSEKVQIDATIADFYLVRENFPGQIIGRPVIFLIKDAYSRIITGMHVTLDNASWNQALLAIKNSAEDKVAFCRRFGVEITEEQWPCHHLPSVLIADNGEVGGKGVESLISELGIMVENCPPYRGDLKGIIEHAFCLAQGALKDILPGYVEKDAGTRGADDYRLKAACDYGTFVKALILCILKYNSSWLDEDTYQRTPEMIRDHVNADPLDLWNYGIRYRSGAMRLVSQEDMYRVLLPQGKAKITERGIEFNGLYYTCQEAVDEEWFATARTKGRYAVTVIYDPTCVDHIYVTTEDDRKLITCSLLERSASFSGITEEEMDRYRDEDRKQKAEYTATMNQKNAEFEQAMEKIRRQISSRKAAPSIIRESIKNIEQNRKAEREELSGAARAKRMQTELNAQKEGATADKDQRYYGEDSPIDQSIDEALEKAGLI